MTVAQLICELVNNCNMTDKVELEVPTQEGYKYSVAESGIQVVELENDRMVITVN